VSRNGNGSVHETVTHVAIPAVTGALGVAGGVLLGRTALQKQTKIFGIKVPRVPTARVDMSDMSKQIGEAGKQLGNLAREVKTAREKAEKISRAIS
jgi:hypothetical protein